MIDEHVMTRLGNGSSMRLTEAAGPLYLMTQHYWRAKTDASKAPKDEGLKAVEESIREKLDEQYLKSRASGEALHFPA